jgi:1-aminocyclopropane-1-carboxylate deaminase
MLDVNSNLKIDKIRAPFLHNGVELDILRLDLVHPIVSGNKLFKLHHYIEQARNQKATKLVTSGGPYSNHLAATAYYANENGFKSAAFVRGEAPEVLSHTLVACQNWGMELYFTDRTTYDTTDTQSLWQNLNHNDAKISFVVPEGGFGIPGSKGLEAVFNMIDLSAYSHICTPVGTATTFAGLINGASMKQKIIGIAALPNHEDISRRLNELLINKDNKNHELWMDYHFGGYARKNQKLLDFLNECYNQYQIPLDFVYTGKMLFGIFDKIQSDYFPANSKILCVHTGGLQGNLSLKSGTLVF